jgi:hypothetical protein
MSTNSKLDERCGPEVVEADDVAGGVLVEAEGCTAVGFGVVSNLAAASGKLRGRSRLQSSGSTCSPSASFRNGIPSRSKLRYKRRSSTGRRNIRLLLCENFSERKPWLGRTAWTLRGTRIYVGFLRLNICCTRLSLALADFDPTLIVLMGALLAMDSSSSGVLGTALVCGVPFIGRWLVVEGHVENIIERAAFLI